MTRAFRPSSGDAVIGCLSVLYLFLGFLLMAFLAPIGLHYLEWLWRLISRWWLYWGFKL